MFTACHPMLATEARVALTLRLVGGLTTAEIADAFLKPLRGRKNLTLQLNALVEKVEVVDGRAVAVHYMHRGTRHRETAQDIILCAGAINSPQLLMLSGIGDQAQLKRHKIDVVLDLPAVGAHLKEQPLPDLQLIFMAFGYLKKPDGLLSQEQRAHSSGQRRSQRCPADRVPFT